MIVLPVYTDDSLPEYIMFELQGKLECKDSEVAGITIGNLALSATVEQPVTASKLIHIDLL